MSVQFFLLSCSSRQKICFYLASWALNLIPFWNPLNYEKCSCFRCALFLFLQTCLLLVVHKYYFDKPLSVFHVLSFASVCNISWAFHDLYEGGNESGIAMFLHDPKWYTRSGTSQAENVSRALPIVTERCGTSSIVYKCRVRRLDFQYIVTQTFAAVWFPLLLTWLPNQSTGHLNI